MVFLAHNDFRNLGDDEEEEEEEEEGAGIDDALLGELDDGLVDEELDPLLKVPLDPLAVVEEGPEKEDGVKVFSDDDDEEEEDVDYDSFDDHDEL